MADAESRFTALAESLRASLQAGEDFSLWYSAEESEFVRFNRAQVRQAGHVIQATGRLRLIRNDRSAEIAITLSGDLDSDRQHLAEGLVQLRLVICQLPPDPYLQVERSAWHRRAVDDANLPDCTSVLAEIDKAANGLDLVGIYAAGPLYRGFANSFGALGWHAAHCFNFDWSLFHANHQAVKADYAGARWDAADFASRFSNARQQLEHLGKPVRHLQPGDYRAYLAPAALDEVLGMLSWTGFSARALANKESPLQRLQDGSASFSPLLNLDEQVAGALAPAFGPEGAPRCDVALVRDGKLAGQLVYPRSAREYGLEANCADANEATQSLVMGPGTLPVDKVLEQLDHGLYIGNLWYLNWSDLPAARMTGMTRFATFWVEDGQIQAPVDTMRFDDSLFNLLGDQLEALTQERQLRLSSSTYGERQTWSALLPGALLGNLKLTL
ncbi:TldD/PmbA family protein [Metapseudomonas lalkuanensis]|uniref:TldD/PmbA family protein n=1 Tax=Metapseudomonas lalkuanensis TaxID=2604832 RepID=UPI001CF45555|nr:TldD/PmbA family protein [Pseudomonas lalkuanensis]UCO96024.1 TldD/PmbA family protein [Pseudomonas lalkuanensis]